MGAQAVARKTGKRFVPIERAPAEGLSARGREIVALLLIGFCLYGLLALATLALPEPGASEVPRGSLTNLGGVVGYYIAHGCVFVFGYAAWALFLFLLGYGMLLFLHREIRALPVKALGAIGFTAMLALLLAGTDGLWGAGPLAPYGAGGRLGANLSPRLYQAFGGSGRILVLIFGALVALLLATEWLFSALVARSVHGAHGGIARLRERMQREPELAADAPDHDDESDEDDDDEEEPAEGSDRRVAETEHAADAEEDDDEAEEAVEETDAADAEDEDPAAAAARAPRRARPREGLRVRRAARRKPRAQPALPFDAAYPFPPLELFREPEEADPEATRGVIERNARAIEQRLASFKIGARIVGVSQGPAVTQYEMRIDEGIKVTRIVSFEADLAAALRALSVRVVAPIPGRDTIGIEVPNAARQTVVLRELLDLAGRADDLAIPLFLGRDVAGEPIVEDLAKMPHLLIAGTTGSGKSVCINAILMSILMTRTPRQVRLILIDPKMVELQAYAAVPHLSCDVVTNMKKAPGVLEWAVEEMEKRYALFSAAGVNHIASYNKLDSVELERRLGRSPQPSELLIPYQVLVIDELADLMNVAQKEVEESIQRLAQKSRAVGLHVILATQRPSTDVITGIIKANLPCQIAFKVNRKIDSRVILDINGAEKLLGHGDMLYVPPGADRVTRAQGTFVSDEEIRRVVDYLGQHGPQPSFIPDLVQTRTGTARRPAKQDDLYEQAAEIVLGQQRGSATLLQRALAVGYTRATRLLEMMEEDGLVGPFAGSKSREVLLTLEEWREREAAVAAELEALDGDGENMTDEDRAEDEDDR
jgi:S-DNA-T family DNA segregation ATPase FtsK/SpoIIIE